MRNAHIFPVWNENEYEQRTLTTDNPVYRYICTDKKGNQIFLIYREIQSGAVAKSYMTNGGKSYFGC